MVALAFFFGGVAAALASGLGANINFQVAAGLIAYSAVLLAKEGNLF